jgi:hypothetical protein
MKRMGAVKPILSTDSVPPRFPVAPFPVKWWFAGSTSAATATVDRWLPFLQSA